LLSDVAAGLVGAHKAAVALESARCLSLGVGESVSVAAHHDGVLALTSRAQLAGLPLGVPTLAAALRPVGSQSRFHLSSDARWVLAEAEPSAPNGGLNGGSSGGPNGGSSGDPNGSLSGDLNGGPNGGFDGGLNGGPSGGPNGGPGGGPGGSLNGGLSGGPGGGLSGGPNGSLAVSLMDAARMIGRAVGLSASAAGSSDVQRRMAALGQRLQATAEGAAAALLAAATAQLVDAVWAVSVERGQDPADFPLLAYGPAGGLFAAAVATQLGMRSVVIPPAADLLTAYGALSAPVLRERSRLLRCEASGAQQRGLLEATLRALTDELRRDLLAEGRIERGHPTGLQWSADLRYAGQAHTLTLAGLGEGGPAPDGATDLVVRFHQEHERRYGFTLGERPVELELVRVRAAAPIFGPSFVQLCQLGREAALQAAAPSPAVPGGVILYGALPTATAVAGPVVIAEPSVSTFVPAGWTAELDKQGAIWLRRAT
ncbi:MAG TPA: hydantoinase/oxoprolinase family protein, partial [Pseudomonadota bacterium]|nr:hydantoinase/oxoprolinase family protein [Pseudomonadota bacterium]